MSALLNLFPFVLLGIALCGLFLALWEKKDKGIALIAPLLGIFLSSTLLAFLLGFEQANFVTYQKDPSAYQIPPETITEATAHFKRLKFLIQLSYASALTSLLSLLFLQLSSHHIRWISWLAFCASCAVIAWGIWFSIAPDKANRALFRKGTAEFYLEPAER